MSGEWLISRDLRAPGRRDRRLVPPAAGLAILLALCLCSCRPLADRSLPPSPIVEEFPPIFAGPAEMVALDPGPRNVTGIRLRSRRLGIDVGTVPGAASRPTVLVLPADIPPDYFDVTLLPGEGEPLPFPLGRGLRVLRGSGKSLRVVHLTDIHYGESLDKKVLLERAVEAIRLLDPDLVLCSGDLMTNPSETGYRELKAVLGRIPAPVFHAPGNHDHDNLALFQRYFSDRTYYSFDVGRFHFIALDTGPPADNFSRQGEGLKPAQVKWLEEDLAAARGKSTYIFLHHSPMRGSDSFVRGREDFARLAREYGVKAVFAGHLHQDALWDLGESSLAKTPDAASLPVIHTTTLGSARLQGKYHGVRLAILSEEGVAPSTPPVSIPLGAISMDCYDDAGRLRCMLENRTGMVIPGIRLDLAGRVPESLPWSGKVLWRGFLQDSEGFSIAVDLAQGDLYLPLGLLPYP